MYFYLLYCNFRCLTSIYVWGILDFQSQLSDIFGTNGNRLGFVAVLAHKLVQYLIK